MRAHKEAGSAAEEDSKAFAKAREDEDEPAAERDSEDVRHWKFLTHLRKRMAEGSFSPLRGGPRAIVEEYRLFQQRKNATIQKYETYETVLGQAEPSFEYYMLLILSCLIATFGLLQDSAAVIIGAMIVAPLMGPILGLSAGVLWGSPRAILKALWSLGTGVLIVLGLTSLIGLILPFAAFTAQMVARTQPGLLDIAVALASGLVGAYAYVNKRISGSLSGVAIAVALMPPLSVTGLCMGRGELSSAGGAALLFSVNLLGISLAALLVFWLVGLHPHATADETEKAQIRKRALGQVLVSLLALAAIAAPMTVFSLKALSRNELKGKISSRLEERIPRSSWAGLDFLSLAEPLHIRWTVYGEVAAEDLAAWDAELEKIAGRPVELEIYSFRAAGRQSP